MEIHFKNKKLKKIFEDDKQLKMAYGTIQSKKIVKRTNELNAAESLYDISRLSSPRLHPLAGEWKGHFSIDVVSPYRLVFLPLDGALSDIKTITKIKIIGIIDTH